MTTAGPVNFRDLYFKYKSLTRISGKPTFSTLHNLLLELKANAVYTPSTLGGGAHGFIGSILYAPIYTTLVPYQPFITPVHTGPQQMVHGAT